MSGAAAGAAVSVGVFDGVHLGHQRILATALERATAPPRGHAGGEQGDRHRHEHRRLEGHRPADALRQHGYAEHRPAVIVEFHDIPVPDAPRRGIRGMNPRGPPGIPVFQDAVGRDLVQPRGVLVVVGVEGEPGVGGDHLERITLEQLRSMPFPARDVAWHGRSFLVVGKTLAVPSRFFDGPVSLKVALPAGYEFVAIHAEGRDIPALMEHHEVTDRLNGWFTPEACFNEAVGYAFLHQGKVVTVCMSDCTLGERIEIGIWTASAHRRKGLAAMAAAATVEACLGKGYTHIGWQCLANNIGSRSVARKVGFELDCECIALSSSLPTENPGDLSPAECLDWALHYESAPPEDTRSCYRAAATRALLGQPDLALQHLRRLLSLPWGGSPDWFDEDFRFDSLRQLSEFQDLVAQFRSVFRNNVNLG